MTQSRKLTLYNWFTKLLPDCRMVKTFRLWLLKVAGVKVGKCVEIGDGVVFRGEGYIEIGNNVKIYDEVYILCKRSGKIVIGSDVIIGTRAYFESGGIISVGDRSGVWQNCILTANCGSSVVIGSDCKIAHLTSLKTTTHFIAKNETCIGGSDEFKNICIGSGAWLCAGCIILPGVTIGERSLVAAGSVVTDDTPSLALVAGVPAVIKKKYE